jgi:hypothetical protein
VTESSVGEIVEGPEILRVTLLLFAVYSALTGPVTSTRPLSKKVAISPSTMMWTSIANPQVMSV